MSIACTFPGKHGDLLWALPTVRAISRAYDEPVHLIVSPYVAGLIPVIERQPYIASATALPEWQVFETAPMTPRVPPAMYSTSFDRVYHLGYEGWPIAPLPYYIYQSVRVHVPEPLPFTLDLEEPWITTGGWSSTYKPEVVVGFTDEWFELKVGLTHLLDLAGRCIAPVNSRWWNEAGTMGLDWAETACLIKDARLFLGCCSAMHVLAAGIGKKVVVMEPNEHRWHPIFWPYGKSGHPRVRCVLGGDGKPTFDARHTRDLIEEMLQSA